MQLAEDAAAHSGSTRDYARGSVRREVLRAAVPCLARVVHETLARQFAQQLQEYTLCANDRAADAVPKRVGAELLNWGRRCDQAVAVPGAWLVASGARFVAGNAHRREVLGVLGQLWGAQAELTALELSADTPDAAAALLPAAAPLWVVDFRRVQSPAAAMCGAIPVCSLDGRTLAAVPAAHAAAMRERSPRLADALRIGFANFEFWAAHAKKPEAVQLTGADAAVFREQCAAFVSSPGAVHCKTLVYYLDTHVADGACAHRPGALASQVYVGIVGSKEADQLVNTLGKRMLQHLAGDEMLVDMELQNPALRCCAPADAGDAEPGPRPAMLVLPLDFGTPGLHGKHSVGGLEGVYMRYFDCVSPLGLNATRSRGERAYSQAAWALFVQLNESLIATCVSADAPCPFVDVAALPAGLREALRTGRPGAAQQLLEAVTQGGDFALHGPLPDGVLGVPFQALLDRAVELNVVCLDTYKTTAKQRALHGGSAATLLRAQRTGCGAALNTDLIHDSTGDNGNYAFWHRATHEGGWSLTRLLYPRNPAKVTDEEVREAIVEARAAREAREAASAAAPSGRQAAAGGKRRRNAPRADSPDDAGPAQRDWSDSE